MAPAASATDVPASPASRAAADASTAASGSSAGAGRAPTSRARVRSACRTVSRRVSSSRRRSAAHPRFSASRAFRASAWAVLGSPAACAARAQQSTSRGCPLPGPPAGSGARLGPLLRQNASAPARMARRVFRICGEGLVEKRESAIRLSGPMRSPASKVAAPQEVAPGMGVVGRISPSRARAATSAAMPSARASGETSGSESSAAPGAWRGWDGPRRAPWHP